jgi:hypothetical protein
MGNVPGSPPDKCQPFHRAIIDDKVAADQRGHGLGVSLGVYSISGVQRKIDAAKRLESEVIQIMKPAIQGSGQPRNRPVQPISEKKTE